MEKYAVGKNIVVNLIINIKYLMISRNENVRRNVMCRKARANACFAAAIVRELAERRH